ncbi:D(1A) dopamine receptor [Tachyglossus aculeatus]|nr:D(1A) dopamine receptor [Tachyglossus aculeatus]
MALPFGDMTILNGTTMDQGGPEADGDSTFRILAACFLSLLILSTLLGNTLVCAAVVRFRHLRSKVTNFFVISLAVSDLLVAVLVMPWKAVAEVAGFWPFGSFCSIWVAFDIMCSTASILNLCVISVDRYWAISSPFRYERKMTPKAAFVLISVAWTLSVLISFIPVQLNWHRAKAAAVPGGNGSSLVEATDNCDASLSRTYAISSSLISFYIPVAIMIVTYTRIYRIAQKQIRRISALERAAVHAKNCQNTSGNGGGVEGPQPESNFKMSFKRETKVLKTLSVIMGVFVCCWLPFFILNCMVPFCESHLPDDENKPFCIDAITFDVFVWFGWANSSLNPIIYAFNADFRKAFSTLLGCYRLCPVASNAIETVSINNNGAVVFSSHHEPRGSLSKEGNPVYLIPHTLTSPEGQPLKEEQHGLSGSLEKMVPALSATLDYEADVSLEKINPITQNGQHKT